MENKPIFLSLVGIIDATNLHIDSCTITTKSNLAGGAMNAVDFFTGWHDVSVTNSTINLQNDLTDSAGGTIYFRDLQGSGASDAVFTNNTVYKYSRDEILWISASQASSNMDNIDVSGNRFYIGDPILATNVYTVAARAAEPDLITNLRIHDNEIIGQGTGAIFALSGTLNADITDNDLYNRSSSPSDDTWGTIFRSFATYNGSNSTGTLARIHHNRTITYDSAVGVGGIASGAASAIDITDNPRVTINAPSFAFLINQKGSFINNGVVANGNNYYSAGAAIIDSGSRDVQNNNILINGSAPIFFRNRVSDLTGPVTYTGNTIVTTKKQTGGSRFAHMWSFYMNNYPMTFQGNTIVNGSEVEDDESLELFTVSNMGTNIATSRTAEPAGSLWQIDVSDTDASTTQTVYICNNTFKGFRNKIGSAAWRPTINMNCN